jgi:ATP-dependent helicase/nuclease subunit B
MTEPERAVTTVRPSVWTIPPGESFVDALARRLLAETADDPLALSAMLILLPTRRACRALRDCFLRQSDGRPLLLPRMRPLGDADEEDLEFAGPDSLDLRPAMPSLRRQLLLAKLIMRLGSARGGGVPNPEQAVRLAGELGRLLDQVQAEDLDFGRLEQLVPADYAAHWQITLDFLKILTQHWPAIVEQQGFMDAVPRRNRLLDIQATAWEESPPDFPVIAAGSTGSIPATARLLSVVARLPRGRLVLPGLDREMDETAWESLEQSHPQYGLARLLDRLGLDRRAVPLWPGCTPSRRAWLISETMRPAANTDVWRHLGPRDTTVALGGVSRLDCPGPREEAGAIALMMRETLEHPERTAALITPDRALARRVAGELRRFDIEIDDSAGRPLDLTPPGTFLLLTAAMVAEDFAPHATLAALKHPLAGGGLAAGVMRGRVRRLERLALRGPRPAAGIAGLRAAVAKRGDLDPWLAELEQAAAPFVEVMARPQVPLADLLRTHVAFAETLAADDRLIGAARLWAGEAGAQASNFLRDLADAAHDEDGLPPMTGAAYPGLLRGLMSDCAVRPAWGSHPRLSIWGPLEARLQHADLTILGSLNEGTWPADAAADPWMSRPMRRDFGLPLPERRIGLSAHDFAQAFCAPNVVLTRAARVEGTPTVPSRWLLRLDAVLRACGATNPWANTTAWLDIHALIDRPASVQPTRPPAPRPPLAARPRQLSATAIETWMRDPYAIYARKILGLTALEPIDADPGAADYGTIIHDALDAFLTAHPRGPLPPKALERLLDLGRQSFGPALARPGQWAFWWPRFERIAEWFVAHEAARRTELSETRSEIQGRLEIAAPYAPFVVTAKADRVDMKTDGSLVLIDYKTGAPPSPKEVAAGYAPQLPIEAAIARHGGFDGVPARPVSALLYWRLSGGTPGGEEKTAGSNPQDLAAQALEGLAGLVRAFDDETTPYEARPHPDKAPKYSDYLHLARVREWSGGGEDSDE